MEAKLSDWIENCPVLSLRAVLNALLIAVQTGLAFDHSLTAHGGRFHDALLGRLVTGEFSRQAPLAQHQDSVAQG
jgi:hypothetical protein